MDLIFLGDYIKQRQKDLGLTQGQLCEGICDVATISRMERGEQIPHHSTVSALLERLGTTYDQYVLLSKEEIGIVALQREINSACVRLQQGIGTEQAEVQTKINKMIDELKRIVECRASMEISVIQQYLLSINVILRTLEGSISPHEEITILLNGIRITAPKFDPAKISHRLFYSLEEIRLISQLGLAYSNHGDHKKAVGIFSQLHTYVTGHNYGLAKSGGGMPLVAHNYARELTLRKQYEDALSIAEEGREACIEYGHYQFFPGLLHIMAECQHFLGNDKESIRLYKQAYHLYQVFKNAINCCILQEEVSKYHHIDLGFIE